MNTSRIILLTVLIAIVAAYVFAGGDKLLDPRLLQAQFEQSPLRSALIYFFIFLMGTALSLPVCAVLSVTAGFIFGNLVGLPLALLALTCGGTVAFLISRYLLRDLIQTRFAEQLTTVNNGMQAEGAFYVFSLRMIPVIPFWLLNLVLGLTPITSIKFFFATLFGMLPITAILVNFGSQLSTVEQISVKEVLTPGLILSLILLATMPFLAKFLLAQIRKARAKNRAA